MFVGFMVNVIMVLTAMKQFYKECFFTGFGHGISPLSLIIGAIKNVIAAVLAATSAYGK